VPREKVVVFLHIGHSNMAGRTDTPPELRSFNFETHPQLWMFTELGQWLPAREPLSGDFLTRGRAGPGMSILRTALTMAPDSQIVSIGHGHDGSRGGRCSSFRRGGLLYEIVMGPARELKGLVTFGGILSMLVLMETVFDTSQLATSHECYEGLAADMRADLEDPDIPFLMSDWEMGATGRFSPNTPDAMVAREQLRVAQRNIPRSAIIPTDLLPMSDNHHFDLVGYKRWAERAFAILEDSGWAPWATRR
jgi:Carbohydrate esterase, sialic acid-specific acetylesterase